jgi:hypothetical protein
MNKDVIQHLLQLEGSVDNLIESFYKYEGMSLTSFNYEPEQLTEAKDLVDFRKMQVVGRMKFLLSLLEK